MRPTALIVATALLGCHHDAATMQTDAGATAHVDAATVDGSNVASLSPHGLYISNGFSPVMGTTGFSPYLQQALTLSYVDGYLLEYRWSDLQPTAGQPPDFTQLGADLHAVAMAGKKAELGIAGGLTAPTWVCTQLGSACISMVYQVATPGGGGDCNNVAYAPPWNATYQQLYGDVLSALVTYLKADPDASILTGIKISGIDNHDTETALPSQVAQTVACSGGTACSGSPATCTLTATVPALVTAGYTQAAITQAFLALSTTYNTDFAPLPVGSQVSSSIPNPNGGQSGPVALAMVQALIASTIRPITAQDNGLTVHTGIDPGTLSAHVAGIPVGYQMLQSVYSDPTCEVGTKGAPTDAGVTCNNAVLLAAIQNGIQNGGAKWIEVFPQDAVMFPEAATYAHEQLAP
jgi:hypothetical protein